MCLCVHICLYNIWAIYLGGVKERFSSLSQDLLIRNMFSSGKFRVLFRAAPVVS